MLKQNRGELSLDPLGAYDRALILCGEKRSASI